MRFRVNSITFNKLYTMSSSTLWDRFLVALALSAVASAPSAWAGPLEDRAEAANLYRAGKFDAASAKINSFLVAQPKDPQGRFIKGLILTEQKKVPEAIQMFTSLTEDFPELPEPYNNLAVLYASQGNYDKAKAALELAIHTHPSYATAHENLGDIYAQMARRAYDKALQLDKNNAAALAKLSMVKDLFSAGAAKPPAAATATTQVAMAAKTPVKPAEAASSKAADTKAEVKAPATAATKGAPASVAAAATPAKSAEPSKGTADAESQINAAVSAWAKAWSSKDVAGYLASYAADFETPDGLSRKAWEQQRKERIERPKSISVEVKINKISVTGNEALVAYRQSYKSDTLKANSNKTLKLVKSGDKWLIRQERAG